MDNLITNKSVLFITTKNLDYIRNVQEIKKIASCASSYKVIGSFSKHYIVRLLLVYLKILFCNTSRYDLIFIGFAPQLIIPLFFKFKNNTIAMDFFISMYDTLCFDRKKLKPNSIIGKLVYKIDKNTLKRADYIISDTNAHGDYFSEEFDIDRGLIHTFYLDANKDIFHPMNLQKPDFLKNKYVVLYFGSVLPLQGVDVILDAVNLLKNNTNFFFIIIGPIKQDNIPLNDNIKYIPWVSQNDLARYISYADLCLAGHFNADIAKAKRTIPGKAYIYQAMEKPMILGDNPANHELYSESDVIKFVEMGNAYALVDAITSAFL